MSRTGKRPIQLPEKVKARVAEDVLHIEGPLGKQSLSLSSWVKVQADAKQVVVDRIDNSREARQTHGLFRSLIQNMVFGVANGFTKNLQIEGVGFRAEVKGNAINLSLGYSHPVVFEVPQGIKASVEKQTRISLSGIDKSLVGQVAADIRSLRPPEPYKGKGIRYADEVVQRKVGKAAAVGGTAK